MVQWLRLHAPNVAGTSSVPGWETKLSHGAWHDEGKKTNRQELTSDYRVTYGFSF